MTRPADRRWPIVYGRDDLTCLYEPPVGPLDPYRSAGVGHLRLRVDQGGRPHRPAGEVYHLRPFLDGSSPKKITEGRLGADVR